ncbi:MAG: hypothetical protein OEO21_05095 [Candidatus Krumholzibacteria bacterium]|nr:hypothetical protein [Candidatus Krumholzibacteria bacterium]
MRTWNRKPRRSSSGALAAVALTLALSVVAMPAAAPAAEAPDTTASAPPAPKKTILRENNYYYGAFNRRDPFRSLVDGTFVRNTLMELVDLTAVELVGVVRGDLDRFALLEDEKGFTYIMRVGDKVRNGTVVAIGDDTMTARITTFGQTSQYTLHMVQRQKGDKR